MLHTLGPSAEALAGLGFAPEDFEDDAAFEVWPENWPAIDLYTRNRTQWRYGPNGPIGLDYPVFWADMERQGVTGDDAEDLMGDIKMIEAGALEASYAGRE